MSTEFLPVDGAAFGSMWEAGFFPLREGLRLLPSLSLRLSRIPILFDPLTQSVAILS